MTSRLGSSPDREEQTRESRYRRTLTSKVAEALITRIHREAVGGAPDEATLRLLEEVLAFPGVPRRWQRLNPETPLLPVIPVTFRKGTRTFAYFSTVTTLGTAQDVTLQELRIECFFPLDAETERNAAELAAPP